MSLYLGSGKLFMRRYIRQAKKQGRTFGSSRKLKLWRKRNLVATIGWRSIGNVTNLNISIGGENGRTQGSDPSRGVCATVTGRWPSGAATFGEEPRE